MNKTLLSAASALAILAGSSLALAQTGTTGTAQQPPAATGATGAQTGAQMGAEQWQDREMRATVESIDKDAREVTLRFTVGSDADLDAIEEGDEVQVSFEGDDDGGIRDLRRQDD